MTLGFRHSAMHHVGCIAALNLTWFRAHFVFPAYRQAQLKCANFFMDDRKS